MKKKYFIPSFHLFDGFWVHLRFVFALNGIFCFTNFFFKFCWIKKKKKDTWMMNITIMRNRFNCIYTYIFCFALHFSSLFISSLLVCWLCILNKLTFYTSYIFVFGGLFKAVKRFIFFLVMNVFIYSLCVFYIFIHRAFASFVSLFDGIDDIKIWKKAQAERRNYNFQIIIKYFGHDVVQNKNEKKKTFPVQNLSM